MNKKWETAFHLLFECTALCTHISTLWSPYGHDWLYLCPSKKNPSLHTEAESYISFGLLGHDAAQWYGTIPTFRRTMLPPSSLSLVLWNVHMLPHHYILLRTQKTTTWIFITTKTPNLAWWLYSLKCKGNLHLPLQ